MNRCIKGVFTFVLCMMTTIAQGQCPANDCACMLKTADQNIEKKDYKKAIFNYLAARACNPELGREVDEKLVKVFENIEQQKAALAKTLQQVEVEQKKTEAALQKAQDEQAKTQVAQEKTEAALVQLEDEQINTMLALYNLGSAQEK